MANESILSGKTSQYSTPVNVLSSVGSLNDPLGLTVAPNGHILVVNGNDGFVTEVTPRGAQIASKTIIALLLEQGLFSGWLLIRNMGLYLWMTLQTR